MKFYVMGMDVNDVKAFFSPLSEDKRPRIVADKEYPAVWDHPADNPELIVTDAPRTDVDAREVSIEGKQPEDVIAEISQPEADDPMQELPDPEPETEKVKGPFTYADRGFKVGRI